MASVSDVETTRLSGLNHIDALLGSGPGWNWLAPQRNVLKYTFSITSGNEVGNTSLNGPVTAFNNAQQLACLAQLAAISKITGIQFSATTDGLEADLHFGNVDIGPDASTSGLCSYGVSYAFNDADFVVGYSAKAYVYLDNAEWASENSNPVAGSSGFETLLHELGHALGLKHPFDSGAKLPINEDNTTNTVMSYTSGGKNQSTFSPYDVAALMWLYGGDGLGGQMGAHGNKFYFTGNAANNAIMGGAGIDTAAFSGKRANYTLQPTSLGFTVNDSTGVDGKDTLSSIERLQFADTKLALDLGGSAGITAKILGAVFGVSSLSNKAYVGIGLGYLDSGMGYADLMQLAIDARLGGRGSNTEVVNLLYTNVVGSPPDADAMAFYKGLLDNGTYTQATLGVMAADTSLNTVNINLVGLTQSGVEFV